MNTYIKTSEGRYAAIRAPRAAVAKLPQIESGEWKIIAAAAWIRRAAKINAEVKTLHILADGRVGYL